MATFSLDISAIVFAIVLCLYLRYRERGARAGLPLPPGPRKLPIIGNLLDIPKSFEWITYHRWSQELGSNIIHLDIAGQSVIVLDDIEAVSDLLHKRSAIYSGRARMPMVNELMGWDFHVGWMPYGDRWRDHRRLLQKTFGNLSENAKFFPYELKACRRLLCNLLESPDDLFDHLLQMAGETIMEYTYGLEIKPKNDPYVTTAFEAAHTLFTAAIPGAFLVDSLPILKYVPDWMPFADFKRKAKAWRKLAQDMVDKPFEAAKKNIENGDTTPSFVLSCLQDLNESKNPSSQELVVKATAGSMYTAGSDTTVAAIASCILALLHNPSIIQKAREEIDRVVGPNRLPNFDDTESLPYVTAITKESLRWRDVAPIAVPHFLEDDDEYKGYRIPKGSIVVPNAWAMLHDETVYPQPFEFNPDRFLKDGKLDPDVKDPDHAAFGFGRRICPGRHMAFSAIWITMASILATFDINKARDADGNIIEPLEIYSSAIVCIPAPYKCDIKPRSKQAVALINTAVHEENWS